jgi:hypothetical protein
MSLSTTPNRAQTCLDNSCRKRKRIRQAAVHLQASMDAQHTEKSADTLASVRRFKEAASAAVVLHRPQPLALMYRTER